MVRSTLFIMRNELLTVSSRTVYIVLYKFNHSQGVRSVLKLKVNTMATFFTLNINAFFLDVVLQHKLLKEKECSLMFNSLSDLHLSLPEMGRVYFFAFIALQVLNYKFDNHVLLKLSSIHNLLLNSQLHLKSS